MYHNDFLYQCACGHYLHTQNFVPCIQSEYLVFIAVIYTVWCGVEEKQLVICLFLDIIGIRPELGIPTLGADGYHADYSQPLFHTPGIGQQMYLFTSFIGGEYMHGIFIIYHKPTAESCG